MLRQNYFYLSLLYFHFCSYHHFSFIPLYAIYTSFYKSGFAYEHPNGKYSDAKYILIHEKKPNLNIEEQKSNIFIEWVFHISLFYILKLKVK